MLLKRIKPPQLFLRVVPFQLREYKKRWGLSRKDKSLSGLFYFEATFLFSGFIFYEAIRNILSSKGAEGNAARVVYNQAKQDALAAGKSEKEAQAAGFEAVAEMIKKDSSEGTGSEAYVKSTESSKNVSLDKLRTTEEPTPESIEKARQKMKQAKEGIIDKRTPLAVIDRGDGTYAVLDGNNTLAVLKELGVNNVSVEVRRPFQKDVEGIEKLYTSAKEAESEFNSLVKEFNDKVGGELKMRPSGLKTKESATKKAKEDHNGDYGKVVDVLGGSLVFDTEENLIAAYEKLKDDPRVIRVKDKWNNPDDTGYRDINMNVRLSNGHIAEVQLHHKGIIDAKNSLGHKLYKFITENNKTKTTEAQNIVSKAKELSRIIYQAGVDGRLQGMDANLMASASDIVRRLSSQTSTRDPVNLLNDLSGIILKTFGPSESVSKISGNSSENSTANGISSPFSKNLNNVNTSNQESIESISSQPEDVNDDSIALKMDSGIESLTIRDVSEDVKKLKEKIKQIKEKYKEKFDKKQEKNKDKYKDKLDKEQEKYKEKLYKENVRRILEKKGLLKKLREANEIRRETRKIIKGLNAAAEADNINWDEHNEINGILDKYDLKQHRKSTLDRRAEMEAYLAENPEAGESFNPKDMKYLGRFTNLTLGQLRKLGEQINDIKARGKEKYIQWEAENRERQDNMFSDLSKPLPKPKPKYGATNGRSDTKIQYKGLKGFLNSAKNFIYRATLPAQKFFDSLDKGLGKYKGPFVKNFVDRPNAARDMELTYIFKRTTSLEKALKGLGFEWKDFGKTSVVDGVPTVNGKPWKLEDKLSVYAGMQNEKHAKAILYGNLKNLSFPDAAKEFILDSLVYQGVSEQEAASLANELTNKLFSRDTEDNVNQAKKLVLDKLGDEGKSIADMIQQEFKYVNNPEGAAQAIIDSLSANEKAAADLIMKDYAENIDRIEQAHIQAYGYGFNREKNYTPMWKLEFESNEGIIDADTAEALVGGKLQSGALGDVKRGFTINRQEISNENQQAVELGLMSIWKEAVKAQEHMAAYGGLLRDLRAVMRMRNPVNPDLTLGKQIRLAYGDGAWKTLIEHYNVMVNDKMIRDTTDLGKAANKLSHNMNIAYLAYNPGTYIKQTTSIARFLQFTDPIRMSSSLNRFIANPKEFLEAIYEKDPQMRDRVPDYIMRELKNEKWHEKGVNLGLVPISVFDKITCAVGWQAVYETNLAKGKSVKEATREAQRSVILTQPASHIKDVSPILRTGGVEGALTKFSRDRLARWGALTYDIPQSVRRILEGDVKGGGRQLIGTSAGIIIGSMIYQLVTQGIPDKDKKEKTSEWVVDAVISQVLDAIPVIGPGIESIRQGNFYSNDSNPLAGPFTKTVRGITGFFKDKKERVFLDLLEGAGLATGKIPYTGLRRLYQSLNLLSEGETMRAAKTAIGMKNEDRFDKVASTLSNEFKEWVDKRKSGEKIPITDRLRQNERFKKAKQIISNIEKAIKNTKDKKRISELENKIKKIKEEALKKFDEVI